MIIGHFSNRIIGLKPPVMCGVVVWNISTIVDWSFCWFDFICFAFWGMPILFALSMPMCQIYPGKSNAQFALEIWLAQGKPWCAKVYFGNSRTLNGSDEVITGS